MKMQEAMDLAWQACHKYDLKILRLSNSQLPERLQVVHKFTYLGSTLSREEHIDDEVNARIA